MKSSATACLRPEAILRDECTHPITQDNTISNIGEFISFQGLIVACTVPEGMHTVQTVTGLKSAF